MSSSFTVVPSEFLHTFVTQCIASLQTFTVNENSDNNMNQAETLSQLRKCLLKQQHDCLANFVSTWNNNNSNNNTNNSNNTQQTSNSTLQIVTMQQVQEALRNSPQHCQHLDHAARLAFARLVLTTVVLPLNENGNTNNNRNHQNSSNHKQRLQRADLLEFCGLCMAAVQLPIVQHYLAHGNPGHTMLFAQDDNHATTRTFVFPQERLERMQQHFWKVLSYDVQVVKSELHRLFFQSHDHANEFTNDSVVQTTFVQLVNAMNAAIVTATHQAQEQAMRTTTTTTTEGNNCSSTYEDDTTRVVSVQYSESLVVVDAATGKEETIASSSSQNPPTHTLPIAAEQMQQEIWAELLSLRDEQRHAKLQKAAVLAHQVQETALALSDWEERKQYLQSMDVETQKQLIMHKLWNDWIQQHPGGVVPAIRYQSS